MSKSISFYASFGRTTGYQNHATDLCDALEKITTVYRNQPGGDVSISLLDSVSIQNVHERLPYPSFVMNAWESTLQPDWFIDRLKFFDGLMVVSEWQRACSIAQGIPEEFVFTTPEGVDPEIFRPVAIIDEADYPYFDFLMVGKWESRKSNLQICLSFLAAFPLSDYPNVRLHLSCDTMFPCDQYKTTEERLIAHGIADPRICVVHFEERADYVRRLQRTHVFLSCAKAEGFFLPGIEAMACGIPSIFSDYGGSTEYAKDALLVNVPKLEDPEGIYGGWKVPGKWGSPDYDHLVEVMKDAYENYPAHKEKALKTSEYIRTEFSWKKAAQKAYDIIQAISVQVQEPSPEYDIRSYARNLGYEIPNLIKRKSAFILTSFADTDAKLETLKETIAQLKAYPYPIILTSHHTVPESITATVDYFIYDKNDPLSPSTDMPIYWRTHPDGHTESTPSSIPCHALAGLTDITNGLDFCAGKFDFTYIIGYDAEVDIDQWIDKVTRSSKSLCLLKYEGQDGGVGAILAGTIAHLNRLYPRIKTWEEFASLAKEDRFCAERWVYKLIVQAGILNEVEWLDVDVGNRFDQVDRNAWKDDLFHLSFMDGPCFHIGGLSAREYDVTFSTPECENIYSLKMRPGMWASPSKKYFMDWRVKVLLNGEEVFNQGIDLSGKNVIVSFGSKALGDTIAWIPYVSEFQKKHNCNVYCSTWWNGIMDYPNINFVKPGDTVEAIFAAYDVGCYDGQLDKNVTDWRRTPLQKVAADQLGVEYKPLRAQLKYTPKGDSPKPYMCFSEFSTMKNKFWNREGAWQKVIDYCTYLGYDCVSISAEQTQLLNVVKHNGQSIEQTLTDLSGAAFYIGLNHGPIWLATALSVPAVLITGVAEEWNDFPNPYRISVDSCGHPCFNDPSVPIERSFEWCPRNLDYACTKDITEEMVIEMIDKIRG